MDEIQQRIEQLFTSHFQTTINAIELLQGAGSSRKYYRISSSLPYTVLACYGSNCDENQTFTYFCSIFEKANIAVPHVFTMSEQKDIYFISDLGQNDVLSVIKNKTTEEVISLYKRILQDLITIQLEGGKCIDFSRCFARPQFDKTAMMWDLYYFKYYYLKLYFPEINDQKLEEDYQKLVDFLCSADAHYFMYRDFQARNILLNDNKLGYIDFQGGMKGPLQYDVVSLLYQAKANLSEDVREELLSFYIPELQRHIVIDEQQFRQEFQGFVYLRILQTLGAYGYRGYIQGKEHFLQSIPLALQNVKTQNKIISKYLELPYLSELIDQMGELKVNR